jgi:hypothetical protein
MLILLFFLTIFGACAAERFPEQAKDSESIRHEQYLQMDRYFDQWIAKAANRRAEYWKRLDFSSVEAYERSVRPYREEWSNYLAVPQPIGGAPRVRQVKVHEFNAYTAYRVWVDALPGVQAYGILLIPKKAGRKPALICLHGHQGTPEIIAGFLPDAQSQIDTYRMFARTAVERGYVVWCPLILSYYSEEHEPQEGPNAQGRDILQKKAIVTGHTLMGLEIAKIRRGIDFLEGLPDVDPRRIGIYGLSKGGHYTLSPQPWSRGSRRWSSRDGLTTARRNYWRPGTCRACSSLRSSIATNTFCPICWIVSATQNWRGWSHRAR